MRLGRAPIRLRLTLAYTAAMVAVLGAVTAFVFERTELELLAAIDAGIRSRAEVLAADISAVGPRLAEVSPTLIENDEAFAQVADSKGRIVQSSRHIEGEALLPPATITSLATPTFFDRQTAGIDGVTRVLAVPVDTQERHWVVLVGASLQDRHDALVRLAVTLGIGGLVALVLSAVAGWLVAGAALRPIERLRRDAADIQVSDPGRRLAVAGERDEIERLGTTLNELLDRLERSIAKEHRFLDDASHELRTPVTILKGELELAGSPGRSVEELRQAISSAAEEADHVADLADGLLLLSRAGDGGLRIQRELVDLSELAEQVVGHVEPEARRQHLRLEVDASRAVADIDRTRVRQAMDNVLSNAIRHTPPGGVVRLDVSGREGTVVLTVEDSGCGFPADLLPNALNPFTSGPGGTGSGLGLSIVRAIAEAHGGTVQLENRPGGGARVVVTLVRQ
ncbi:MAG: ATP-binding protein [Nocardioidaceae bacterium]